MLKFCSSHDMPLTEVRFVCILFECIDCSGITISVQRGLVRWWPTSDYPLVFCLFVDFCLPCLLPSFVLCFFLLQVFCHCLPRGYAGHFCHCPPHGYAGHNSDTSDLEYTNTDANVQWLMSPVHSLVPKVITMWTCIWCSPFPNLWVLQCPIVHKSGCVWTQALLTSSSVATENFAFCSIAQSNMGCYRREMAQLSTVNATLLTFCVKQVRWMSLAQTEP